MRLGYDYADPWRDLLRTHRNDIAAAMNIPPTHFRWYAAFHDEQGFAYMERAARNGHDYARLFLERQDNLREPNLMLAATKLLYRLGKVFQENSLPQTGSSLRIDRKRWRQLQEKRMALGHRAEDHELDENEIEMTIQ